MITFDVYFPLEEPKTYCIRTGDIVGPSNVFKNSKSLLSIITVLGQSGVPVCVHIHSYHKEILIRWPNKDKNWTGYKRVVNNELKHATLQRNWARKEFGYCGTDNANT